MKNEIDVQYYVRKYPLTINDKSRLNHEACPAGEDHRERLYIKAVDGGWIAHCFNCGGSGAYFEKGNYKTLSAILKDRTVFVNTDMRSAALFNSYYKARAPITDIRIKTWLYGYEIFEEDWDKLGLRQSMGDLWIPLTYDSAQVRSFSGGPKYANVYKDTFPAFYPCISRMSEGITLVEDVLSAYRLHRDADMGTVACLGTSVKDELRDVLAASTSIITVYIWLDGDRAGMHASTKAALALSGIKNCIIIAEEKSPKQYTPEQLKAIVKKYDMI